MAYLKPKIYEFLQKDWKKYSKQSNWWLSKKHCFSTKHLNTQLCFKGKTAKCRFMAISCKVDEKINQKVRWDVNCGF